jgi:hypothetical protein
MPFIACPVKESNNKNSNEKGDFMRFLVLDVLQQVYNLLRQKGAYRGLTKCELKKMLSDALNI